MTGRIKKKTDFGWGSRSN